MHKTNKPLTPLQAMTQMSNVKIDSSQIQEIDPYIVKNWIYHDRPENELGDIEGLAAEFKEIGQQQPCIVRPFISNMYKYELIAGERRWKAALLANVKLKVIIKPLSDKEAAIIQISENSKRKDLSDYAKGMNYSKLIGNGVITQKELVEKLGRSKQYISSLLSFSKIPEEIVKSIGNMENVSCRSAEQIQRLASKGPQYIEALIHISDKIKTGKFGQERIENFVNNFVSNESNLLSNNKQTLVKDTKGTTLFILKKASKGIALQFSEKISNFILLNEKKIIEDVSCLIEKYKLDC